MLKQSPLPTPKKPPPCEVVFLCPFLGARATTPLGPGVVGLSRKAIRPAKSEKSEIREETGGCCRWLVLDPVDRAIERPSDRVIELAHALLLAGVGAACPAPQRVRARQFVGVAGNLLALFCSCWASFEALWALEMERWRSLRAVLVGWLYSRFFAGDERLLVCALSVETCCAAVVWPGFRLPA